MEEEDQLKQLREELDALGKKIDQLIEWADQLDVAFSELRDQWAQYDDTHDIDDIPF